MATAVTYQLLQSPTGMAIDSNTGLITWTPARTRHRPRKWPSKPRTQRATRPSRATTSMSWHPMPRRSSLRPTPRWAPPVTIRPLRFNLASLHQQRLRHHDHYRCGPGRRDRRNRPGRRLRHRNLGVFPRRHDIHRRGHSRREFGACCCPITPCCVTRLTTQSARLPPSPTVHGTQPAAPSE